MEGTKMANVGGGDATLPEKVTAGGETTPLQNKSQKSKNANSKRTYTKVYATFQCTNGECRKSWTSAHGWGGQGEDGLNCDFCGVRAKIVNAVDEFLEVDTFNCPCGESWQSIHNEEKEPEQCYGCNKMISADGLPQKRFGRHYYSECKNKNCKEGRGLEFEDFSLKAQKGQRCSNCNNAGQLIKVTKNRYFGRGRRLKQATDGNKENESGDKHDTGGKPGVISLHNAALCDMCQDLISQNKGRSCHGYRKVVTSVERNASGILEEKIVSTM